MLNKHIFNHLIRIFQPVLGVGVDLIIIDFGVSPSN